MPDRAAPIDLQLLVLRGQLGDPAAFTALVAHYAPRLRGYLFKMLQPRTANLDDLLQDVWADVFRDLRRLDDPAAFAPWLYRVARNRVFRAGRDRRDRPPDRPIEDLDELPDAREPPEPFSPEDAAAVHAALDRLPPDQREALLLRFIEEMTYEQIAAVVGCPIGTVRSRIHHGKRALRACLEPSSKGDRDRVALPAGNRAR